MDSIFGWILSLFIIVSIVWLLVYDYQRKKHRGDKEFVKDLEIQGIRRKKKRK